MEDRGETEERRLSMSKVRRFWFFSGHVNLRSLDGLLGFWDFSGLLNLLLLSGLRPSSNTERFLLSGLTGGRLYASMLIERRYLLGPKSKSSPSGLTDFVTLSELCVRAPRGELMNASFTNPLRGLALLLSLVRSPRIDPFLTGPICGLLVGPKMALTELNEPFNDPIKEPLTTGLAVFSSSARNLLMSQFPSLIFRCLSGLLALYFWFLSGLEDLRILSGLTE